MQWWFEKGHILNRKGKDLGGEEGIETSTRSLNLYIFYHYSDLLHSMAREIVTTAINPIFPPSGTNNNQSTETNSRMKGFFINISDN